MTTVSVEEFRQYMQMQDSRHTSIFDRLDQMQQSIIGITGQASVAQVDIDNKFRALGD